MTFRLKNSAHLPLLQQHPQLLPLQLLLPQQSPQLPQAQQALLLLKLLCPVLL